MTHVLTSGSLISIGHKDDQVTVSMTGPVVKLVINGYDSATADMLVGCLAHEQTYCRLLYYFSCNCFIVNYSKYTHKSHDTQRHYHRKILL